MFRQLMRHMTPSAVGTARRTQDMSPAETTLIAVHLAFQKLLNPDYQVPADEWVRSLSRGGQQTVVGRGAPNRVTLSRVQPDIANVVNELADEAPSESSESALAMHMFLDLVGVHR